MGTCTTLIATPFTQVASGNAVLDRFNLLRARHGKKPLTWSAALEREANNSPNGCAMEHDSGRAETLSGYGRNAAGVDSWYTEIKCWDPVRNVGLPGCVFYDNRGCVTGKCYGHVQIMLDDRIRNVGCNTTTCDHLLRCKYT